MMGEILGVSLSLSEHLLAHVDYKLAAACLCSLKCAAPLTPLGASSLLIHVISASNHQNFKPITQ